MLAAQIVKLFPDKFPGDPSIAAVTLRVSLNHLMQEHAYLGSMATSAVIAGRDPEKAATSAALDANAASLHAAFKDEFGSSAGDQLGRLWAARNTALLDYAAGVGAAAKQALSQLFIAPFSAAAGVPQTLVDDQASAALAVVDDQRAKAFTTLAADDRAAAAAIETIADAMAAAGSVQG